jgi:hypothetical protein
MHKDFSRCAITPEERAALLVSAKILTEDGEYHPDFFSEETILKSKKVQSAELSSIITTNIN